MFDQFTDYNENDPDDPNNNNHNMLSPDRRKIECHGEDDFDDEGEGDEDNDLRVYRQRIQVLNNDI